MTDKIISVYWFAILFIVAGAVVYMSIIYYGEPYDARNIEANILVNQVADCLAKGGKLTDNILDKNFKEAFLQECDLNFDVEDYAEWDNDQYYVSVRFSNFASGTPLTEYDIVEGNINLKEDCDQIGKNFPVCVEKSFYVLDDKNVKYNATILSVVKKTEKNVN